MNIQQQIEALSVKISELAKQQSGLSRQIISLMDELEKLKQQAAGTAAPSQPMEAKQPEVVEVKQVITPPTQTPAHNVPRKPTPNIPSKTSSPAKSSTLEEFIGGNL